MASVQLENLSKNFGKVEAVRDASLRIEDGEFVVFVGPSGCGKSTLLRMIAGLEEISSGTLRIGGKPMNDTPAADRGIAMVFQSYALYPHMNVRENIGFGLKMSGSSSETVRAKVNEVAASLQIEELLERRPRELSGGQRQRVAIGRAIVKDPAVFLFDEPLSNLDADLRGQMRVEIARLHKQLGTTVIYVTHDQVEAMTLADRIVVLRGGLIEQEGTPSELYDQPANLFVAQFLGQPKMNLLPAAVGAGKDGAGLVLGSGETVDGVKIPPTTQAGAPMTIGLRPGDLEVTEGQTDTALNGRVELVENLGNERLLHIRLEGSGQMITAIQPKKSLMAREDPVSVGFDPADAILFDDLGTRV